MSEVIPIIIGFVIIGVMLIFIVIGFIDKRRG